MHGTLHPSGGSTPSEGNGPPPEQQRFLDQQGESFDSACLALGQIALFEGDTPEPTRLNVLRAQAQAKINARQSYKQYLANSKQKQQEAATAIQAVVRGYLARTRLQAQKEAATKIQCAVRGLLARRELEKLREEKRRQEAATTIQSVFRAHQAKQQLKALQTERDNEIDAVRQKIDQKRNQSGPIILSIGNHFPCDTLIANIAANGFDQVAHALELLRTGGDFGAYQEKLLAIEHSLKALWYRLCQRVELDRAVSSKLKKDLCPLANVATVVELDLKLPNTSSAKAWVNLKAFCSAEVQDTVLIFECIDNLIKYYEEPVVVLVKKLKPYKYDDTGTWDIQPLQFAPALEAYRTVIFSRVNEAIIGRIRDCTLYGRTITRGGRMQADYVMHEHLDGGNCGVGFCYKHGVGNAVTPWIVDYAPSRQDNDYDWVRSGSKKGDPSQTVMPN